MTAGEAIGSLRRLDMEAERDWPGGYDRERVRLEAKAAIKALAWLVAVAPAEDQAILARNYLRALAER